MSAKKSSYPHAWRPQWPAHLRLAALWLRLRHALSIGERVRERWRVAAAGWRHYATAGVRELHLARPSTVSGGPANLIAFIDPRDALAPAEVRRALLADWPAADTALLVLVRYRQPPLLAGRTDAECRSWAAAPALLPRLPPSAECSLLAVLDAVLRQPDVTIRVMQVSGPEPQSTLTPLAESGAGWSTAWATAWVIPHRHHAPWLGECLARVVPQLRPASDDEVLVGLDEAPTPALRAVRAAFPECWFGALRRPGVGPYVVRQRAAERTRCTHLLFQDSDDVPTLDRATVLQTALVRRGLDAVGSHELRLDYLTGHVVAVRFPLDASAALRVAVGHPALFPTLLVRRASLLAVGGFSTYLRFALDTQLLLRAAPAWRLGNVDAFLYLRRRRPGSLTTDPATAFGSPLRECHRAQWRRDYAAVLAGTLPVAASSLAARRGAEYDGNELLPL